jgi:hypothetical protein
MEQVQLKQPHKGRTTINQKSKDKQRKIKNIEYCLSSSVLNDLLYGREQFFIPLSNQVLVYEETLQRDYKN